MGAILDVESECVRAGLDFELAPTSAAGNKSGLLGCWAVRVV